MTEGPVAIDVHAIAREALAALDGGRQLMPFSSRIVGFNSGHAYRVTAAVRELRERRGERVVGRKIGFTNRTIWAEYDVYAPIWGYIYDHTLKSIAGIDRTFPLAGLLEPRIEPEIVFGLASAPTPGADKKTLLAAIEWVAHGFEIVHSIFPRWKFSAPDTIAAFGLHGALLVGPRQSLAAGYEDWDNALAAFDIDLERDGAVCDHGCAANVLGGPLFALGHLVDVLARDPFNPPLAAGEIVTTGTLTRALPVSPGQTWKTTLTGIPLGGVSVRFV